MTIPFQPAGAPSEMNLPNKLTVSRFILTVAFMVVMFSQVRYHQTIALVLFVAGGISDFLDGTIARRRKLITNFGILMDPLADKIMVCSAFIAFVGLNWMPAWMVVIIVARELAITGLRLLAASKNVVLAAEGYGKHKTISQIVAIISILVLASYQRMGPRGPRDLWLPPVRRCPLDKLVHRTRHLGGGRAHLHLRVALPLEEPRHLSAGPVKLWIAQGFGVGRIPVAPGTFGSLVGVLWFGLLLMTAQPLVVCRRHHRGHCPLRLALWRRREGLGAEGPGSVVLDEITALPVCFVAWVAILLWQTGSLPSFAYFFSAHTWPLTLGVFVRLPLFRHRQALACAAEPMLARRLGDND